MSIKLIAADLDGTLLTSERKLSPDLFPLIGELRGRGIRFAPASGRQYYNLRELFAPIAVPPVLRAWAPVSPPDRAARPAS